MQVTYRFLLPCCISLLCLSSVQAKDPRFETVIFGKLPSGEEVKQFNLYNSHGMQASVIEYGATITKLLVADRHGQFANVVLAVTLWTNTRKAFQPQPSSDATRIAFAEPSSRSIVRSIKLRKTPAKTIFTAAVKTLPKSAGMEWLSRVLMLRPSS